MKNLKEQFLGWLGIYFLVFLLILDRQMINYVA